MAARFCFVWGRRYATPRRLRYLLFFFTLGTMAIFKSSCHEALRDDFSQISRVDESFHPRYRIILGVTNEADFENDTGETISQRLRVVLLGLYVNRGGFL